MTVATGKPPSWGGPWIPSSAVHRLIAPLIEKIGAERVADLAQVTPRMIYRWRVGEAAWVSFEVVDRIVTDVLDEPTLWLLDPDLAVAYEAAGR